MNQNESNPISLADIARIARVSMTTVSLVLRDMGSISLGTRNRVRKIAQDLGYRPNLAASLLARQSQNHIVPSIPVALIGMGTKRPRPIASLPFLNAFSEYATKIGFQVIEPESADYADIHALIRILYFRGVRGIIFNHDFDVSQLTEKEAASFSFLFYGQSLSDHRFHRVGSEVFESTRLLWETAWERGYRRIGTILCRHKKYLQDDFAREDAVLGCQIRHRAPRVPSFTGGHSDYAEIIEWVKKVRPDAVISFNGAIHAYLEEAGFKIPEDIALSTMHLHKDDNFITGFYQDYEELARVAAHQMETMICHNETGFPARPRSLLVAPVYREGQTLPPLFPSLINRKSRSAAKR